jgi:hypothetical protein
MKCLEVSVLSTPECQDDEIVYHPIRPFANSSDVRALQKEDYCCPVMVGEMKIRSARAWSTARGRSLDIRDFAT